MTWKLRSLTVRQLTIFSSTKYNNENLTKSEMVWELTIDMTQTRGKIYKSHINWRKWWSGDIWDGIKSSVTNRKGAHNFPHCLIFLQNSVKVGKQHRIQLSNLFWGHVWGNLKKIKVSEFFLDSHIHAVIFLSILRWREYWIIVYLPLRLSSIGFRLKRRQIIVSSKKRSNTSIEENTQKKKYSK